MNNICAVAPIVEYWLIVIACISCGEGFRKQGRPQKTAKVDGFSVGCNGGRPHNTTRVTGSFVGDGHPRGTNQEAGFAVSDGRHVDSLFCFVMVNQLKTLVAV